MPRQPYEDPQLTQLAQIAQIAHLLSGPQLGQQEVDQRDQAARLTAAIHLMGLQQEHQQNAATLDELTRYHTGELAHGQAALDAATRDREMAGKSNVTDAIVSHLLQDPSIPTEIKAGTLDKLGYPQMKDALAGAHATELQKRVATHVAAIGALQKSGGQDAVNKYLPALQSDPEVYKAVQAALPQMDTTTASTSTSGYPEGYSPGLAGSVGQGFKYLPITTANLGALLYNKAMVPPLNLVNSLTGAPPLYPTKMAPLNYGTLLQNLLKPESQR